MRIVPQSVKRIWERILTKGEKKGFQTANKMHKIAINTCLIFIGYQFYAFLRDYNNFFLKARTVTNYDQIGEGPLNRKINEIQQ